MIYIKPVFELDSPRIIGYAVCRREQVLVDSDVLSHFPRDATGKEIKACAVRFGWVESEDEVVWSESIIEV